MTHSFPTRRSSDLRHGKDRDIVDLGGRKHFFGALFAAFGALFEHHVDREDEQHDPARDAETVEVDVQEAKQRFAEHREKYEDQPGDDDGANRHRPALLRARARSQAGLDRRAARWIDDDDQSDEGRDEKIDHGCFGAATWWAYTVATK